MEPKPETLVVVIRASQEDAPRECVLPGGQECLLCPVPFSPQDFRTAVARSWALRETRGAARLELHLECSPLGWTPEHAVEVASETLALTSYAYKTHPVSPRFSLKWRGPLDPEAHAQASWRGLRVGELVNEARHLGDQPSSRLTPERLVEEGMRLLGNQSKVTRWTGEEVLTQGFGGVWAVGKGAVHPPAVGVFDYHPPGATTTIALIGKGLTFDTGGVSLKPKSHHDEMKYDCCGAAAVLACAALLGERGFPGRVVTVIGCAENMLSRSAQRPGDVYQAYGGKTVEVLNTDAEGRLVLGDLLGYAGTFRPDLILDVATLTGATESITGPYGAVLCGNQDHWWDALRSIARECDERIFPLEIAPEAVDNLQSEVADLTNVHRAWGTGAPTMLAAAFLQEFVPPGVPWIHWDIASVAWYPKNSAYLKSTCASGFGIRSLLALCEAFSAGQLPPQKTMIPSAN